MDCSRTLDGYFEIKGYSNYQGWERTGGVTDRTCSGPGADPPPPYPSINHFARCGYVNVFKWGGACEILPVDSVSVAEGPLLG